MLYDFACDDCDVVVEVWRPVDQAGWEVECPSCGNSMRRLFYPPRLVARSKPGSFRFERGKMDPWDDRIAHLKHVENTEGSVGLRKARKEVGEKLFNQTLNSKKARYAGG